MDVSNGLENLFDQKNWSQDKKMYIIITDSLTTADVLEPEKKKRASSTWEIYFIRPEFIWQVKRKTIKVWNSTFSAWIAINK